MRPGWWYRLLLRLFPFDFQREYGAEMSDVFQEQHRDARGAGRLAMMRLWSDTLRGFAATAPRQHLAMLRQDAGYAVRMMRRSPLFTAAAVLALGLGIGANSAIFTLLNATFLNPLAVREPSRLVSLHMTDRQTPGYSPISTDNFRDLRDQVTAFEGVAAYTFAAARVTGRDREPEQIFGMSVTGDYFRVLGVEAAHGRTFLPEEDETRGAHAVAVLSDAAWSRLFGRDPAIVGGTVRLNGHPFTVIGITPPRFQGTFALFAPDFYVPLAMYDTLIPGTEWYEGRRWRWLNVLARMKPGADLDQARAATAVVADALSRAYPEINKGRGVAVLPLTQALIDPNQHDTFFRSGLLLAALVAMVLLIACANLANLLLARAAGRTREVALRLALGAGRGRIVRQLLTESLLLAGAGGALGLVLAAWTHRLLWAARPLQFQQPAVRLEIDGTVLAFTAAVSIATGVLFGLAPALHASRADIITTLKEAGRQPSAGRPRFRAALIVGEVALSLFALVVSGLFLRSLWQAQQIDPGFNPDRMVAGNINPGAGGYSVERAHVFYGRLLAELAARPDIEAATITNRPPLSPGAAYTINVEGRLPPPGAMGFTTDNAEIVPGYFAAMGIPLVAGRDFTAADRHGTPAVAIVNEAMARLHWAGTTPVGQRFTTPIGEAFEIVGIARDSKYTTIGEHSTPFFYLPILQQRSLGFGAVSLMVRGRAGAAAVVPTVRAVLRELDPEMPLSNPATLDDLLGQALWAPRLITVLVSAFGALATLLAAVGLYAVMAYTVTLRAHEIGLRMALGASRGRILAAVVGRGMALTAAGVVIGVSGALVAARGLGALLYDVGPTDPVAFVGMPLLLGLVALAACYIPARRAARLDPVMTLRGE